MTESLESFYRSYVPVVSDNHHTCVGLGFDLTKRILELEYSYPGISLALFLASCEEVFDNNPKQTIEHAISYYLLIHMISFKNQGYRQCQSIRLYSYTRYTHFRERTCCCGIKH